MSRTLNCTLQTDILVAGIDAEGPSLYFMDPASGDFRVQGFSAVSLQFHAQHLVLVPIGHLRPRVPY